MKVAVVSHDSFWPVKGGGGIRVFWVVKKLIERGHKVTVIAPFEDTKGLEKEFPNLSIRNLGQYSRFDTNKEVKYIKLAIKVILQLLITRTDVIYAHNIVAAFPSYIVSKLKRKPLVFDIDDLLTGYSKKGIVRRIGKKIEFSIARHASCVITMCESFKKLLEENKVTKKIRVVFHGVNLHKFYPKNINRREKIIYIGGIEAHDGLMMLPEIARELTRKYPKLKFQIIGDGSELSNLVDRVMEYKLINKFDFRTWVKNEDIPYYLNDAKIGVIPTFKSDANEISLSLKGLEYMAMGLPVVASNFPGMREEIGDNQRGLLVEPGNPRELSQSIIRLLDHNQLRSDMGKAGRNFIEQNCDWDVNARKIVKILEEHKKQNKK